MSDSPTDTIMIHSLSVALHNLRFNTMSNSLCPGLVRGSAEDYTIVSLTVTLSFECLSMIFHG